jgi:hypothetical protein
LWQNRTTFVVELKKIVEESSWKWVGGKKSGEKFVVKQFSQFLRLETPKNF